MSGRARAWVPLRDVGSLLTPRVTYQAVQGWIRDGFSGHKPIDGITHVHLPSLIAWRAKFKLDPEAPGHGGKRPGAGRKSGSETGTNAAPTKTVKGHETPAPTPSPTPKSQPLPLSLAEFHKRARANTITKADVGLALDTFKAMEALRAAELAAGRTLDAEDCKAAWGEVLQGFKDTLDDLPGRVEVRACGELSLSQEEGRAIREITLDEVRTILRELLARDWTPPPPKKARR